MPRKPKTRPKSPTPEVYQVEVITAARVSDDGKWEYRVKWAGYPEEDNSWEPHENVQECDRLLKSFWDHVGVDNNDYPIGYQADAKPKWIKKEMAFFAAEFAQQKEAEQAKKAEHVEKKEARKKKKKKNLGKAKAQKKSGSSKDEPTKQSTDTGKSKQVTKTPELGDSDDSQESDDDEPLTITAKVSRKRLRIAVSDDSDAPESEPPRKLSKSDLSLTVPRQPGPSTEPTTDARTETQANPPSSTSLFSESPSPDKAKGPLPKTSSKPQPKIKLMDIEPRNVASGSTLSTKQRIFQNATVPSKTKPVPPSKKNLLAGMGFKKNLPSTTRSDDRSEPESKPAQEFLFSDINDISVSPSSYHNMQDDILHSDVHHPPQRDLPSPGTRHMMSPPPMLPTEQTHSGDPDAAEDFLAQMFPNPISMMDIAEPQPEPISDDPVVPRSLMLPRPPPVPLRKIPKKWKWVGDLFVDTAPEYAEKLCTVTLSDSTDPLQNGLRFSIMLSLVDSVRIKKRLNVSELDAVLYACGPVQQLAKLNAEDTSCADKLNHLMIYMNLQQQAAIIPLFLDNAEVASLIVFPSTIQHLRRRFKVPADLQQAGTFIAALVPWTLTPAEYSSFDIQRSLAKFKAPEFKHTTSRAHQYLEFPHELRAYMSQPQRTYCVWWSPGDGTTKIPGLETDLLHIIMQSCQAKNVGHKSDVRVVFVHIGAVSTLHKLPALAERRSKRPELHFYTYGTHPNVPREQWGVRAIYPLGGIVTFTPNALLKNSFSIGRLMHQIAEHPFWDSYLLPSVVGMAAKLSCEGADPVLEFKKGDSLLHNIITLIAEGDVSLLRAPALHGDVRGSSWASSQLKLFSLNAPGLLEECLKIFATKYSSTSVAQLSDAVEAEISEDLLRMQTQPSMMENYRRFVIVKEASSGETDWNKDGFEWTSVAKFDFKDDFFEKPASA